MFERIDTKAVLEWLPTNPTECSGSPEPHEWDEGQTLEEAEKAGSYCQICGIDAGLLHRFLDARVALAQEIADREALEMERDEWGAATRYLQGHYPEDVFPPNSNTPDAKAGTFARRLLTWLLDPVERARLAALAAEEPMQPTMYAGSSALREWADLHGEQGKGS